MTQLKIPPVFFNVVDQVTLLLNVEDAIVSTHFSYIYKQTKKIPVDKAAVNQTSLRTLIGDYLF